MELVMTVVDETLLRLMGEVGDIEIYKALRRHYCVIEREAPGALARSLRLVIHRLGLVIEAAKEL